MTTGCKVTELFCIIDEFCKHFNAENAGNLLEDNSGIKRRRRQASLSDSEIMTILLYFHFGTFRNFKHYYLFFIKGTMKSYFPKAVSYNRFVELESRVFFQLMFFLNLGAFGRCTGITFVDSTMIPVCHNLRRYTNKVFEGIATDGKGTLTGGLRLYSLSQKEPQRPMYLSLSRRSADSDTPTDGLCYMAAYPVAGTNRIELRFTLPHEVHGVSVTLASQNGMYAKSYTLGALPSGEHRFTITPNLTDGLYIVSMTADGLHGRTAIMLRR